MNKRKNQNETVVKDFKLHDKDCGSSQVQIALLSTRISQITEHLKKFRKDFATQRSLIKLVSQRKSLLKYLHKSDFSAYKELVKRLNLRS